MRQSPNFIHFSSQWQLFGPDSPVQAFSREQFQNLMNRLNESPGSFEIDDFVYRTNRCEMGRLRNSQVQPGSGIGFTKLVFENDKLSFIEEWADISIEEFQKKCISMLNIWFEIFPSTVIIAQNCCLRGLMQPLVISDSRKFLGDHVLNIGQAIESTFKNMPFKVGFTVTVLRPIGQYELVIDTSVNSWRDTKNIWIQVNGSSPLAPPINATNTNNAKEPLEQCSKFLQEEVMEFINQYDKTG